MKNDRPPVGPDTGPPPHDTPHPPGASKLWRLNFVESRVQTITVAADTLDQARALFGAALSGDRQAAEYVTVHPISRPHFCEYPPRSADFASQPELVEQFQRQLVRITDAVFKLDFEGGG